MIRDPAEADETPGVVPDSRASTSTQTRLRVLVTTVTVSGSAAAATSLLVGGAALGPVRYVVLFALLAALTRLIPFMLIRQGEGEEVDADEAVLVAMLVVLPAGGVLAASLAGVALAHLVRRRSVIKTVFNFGAQALAISGAVLVEVALGNPATGSQSAGALAAAACGALTFSVISSASTWWVLATATGVRIRRMALEDGPLDTLTAIAGTTWGVLAVVGTTTNLATAVALSVPVAGSWLVRHNEHQARSLRALLDAAIATGRAVGSGSTVTELTKAADAMLRTQASRLSAVPPEANETAAPLQLTAGRRWLIAGEAHRWDRRRRHDETLLKALAAVGDVAVRNEELLDAAGRDPDTGLITGAVLHERIDGLLDRHRCEGLAVLVVRVPRLDVVNQILGPAAARGQRAEIARRIHLAVKEPAPALHKLVGYLADGDYVVVLPAVSGASAALGAARMLQRQLQQPLTVDDVELTVEVTIGVRVCTPEREPEANAARLLHDALVIAARIARAGGERIQLAEGSQTGQAESPFAVEAELRRGLQRREFLVAYQPIMSTVDERVVGAEALVRWKHPQRGWLQPGEFIPIAEQTALIVGIDRYVLREVANQLRSWSTHRLPPTFTIAVNLSARHLAEPDTVRFARSLLEESGIEAHRITLEVTESSVTLDAVAAASTLEELHRLGFGIAIDDFGTGYSSLLYLRDFPTDTLKIDRSFTARMLSSAGDAAIVAAIIRLGHTLGLSTVAEGVETEEQLAALRSLGCDTAQGFLWTQAVRPEEFRQHWWPKAGTGTGSPGQVDDGTAMDGSMRDDVLPYVIHELRSPLFAIDAYARLASQAPEGPGGPAEAASHLERISHAATTMRAILDDLGDVSTLELSAMSLDIEAVDLNTVITSVIDTLRPTLGERTVDFVPGAGPEVDIDVHRIAQVLRNLLTNADKFSTRDKPVAVTTYREAGRCRVEVRDHGPGIPPDKIGQLFRRFSRLNSTTKGMGIGLHLARKIARAHGGDVTYETPNDGDGSIFVLHLPVVEPNRLFSGPHGEPGAA